MSRSRLAVRALRLKLAGAAADPIPDYDVASATYDDYFTRVMGPHSVTLLDDVLLFPGAQVVELACGTGHLTSELARRMHGRGRLQAVDKSAGMLAVARSKVPSTPDLTVTFTEADMEEFLLAQPDASADLVVIGWAVCYTEPVRLLRQVNRVLKPEGTVAVIETKADALEALRTALSRVVTDDPTLLTSLIRVALPRSERTLARWLERGGFQIVTVRAGEQPLPCRTVEEALEWVERSGAGAGFKDTFNASRADDVREQLGAALARILEERGALGLTHTFVAGVARRPAVRRRAS
jgi:ubiquinone/menaquinone biosynthesis C-methylase UbiE